MNSSIAQTHAWFNTPKMQSNVLLTKKSYQTTYALVGGEGRLKTIFRLENDYFSFQANCS